MSNYIYGMATFAVIGAMVSIIDANVPNNLWYWVDLYVPF
ncbi:MAG: hypothetical protein DHS20C02_08880 [Micavibrio sp.]|nr:MAG: hypothetical protein DHS20C02_08880 [Micavibrio sp.]